MHVLRQGTLSRTYIANLIEIRAIDAWTDYCRTRIVLFIFFISISRFIASVLFSYGSMYTSFHGLPRLVEVVAPALCSSSLSCGL